MSSITIHKGPQQVAQSEFVRDVPRSEVSRLMPGLALSSHVLSLSLLVLSVFFR